MPIELVIWDWNGTLLDDTLVCYEIANDMRRERGMPLMPDVESYRALFGFPVEAYYRRMGYTFESEPYESVSRDFVSRYTAHAKTCPLQPYARETLQAVRARGIRQVLLSATGQDRLIAEIAHFELNAFFSHIIGNRNDLAHGKADYARAFLAENHVPPERTLFVGDTDHDASIAASVGCRAALLIPGHQTRAHLSSLGVPLLESLSDLPALLD